MQTERTPTQKIIDDMVLKEGESKNANIALAADVSAAMISRLKSGKMPLRYGVYKRLSEKYPDREPALKVAMDEDEKIFGPPSVASVPETKDGDPAWRDALATALGKRKDVKDILDFVELIVVEPDMPFKAMMRTEARKLLDDLDKSKRRAPAVEEKKTGTDD